MLSKQPRLYYADDCGFCRWALAWVLRWDRPGRLAPLPIESPQGDHDLGDMGPARFDCWHLVDGGGRHSGGRAIAPLLAQLPAGSVLSPAARRLQFALVPAYDWVAAHRAALGRLLPRRSRERADAVVARRRGGAEAMAGKPGRP